MRAQSEPSRAHAVMALARRAVHSDRRADHVRGRARTMALPALDELDLSPEELATETLTVIEAAEALGITPQAIQQAHGRGSLPMYRDARGWRRVTVVDLEQWDARRPETEQEYEWKWSRAWHADLSIWPIGTHAPWCHLCPGKGPA